ncbi:atos homolog protein A [Diorhabda carinulata]|uniref:atos homolog protein A n=1 Tax=Diorhabda carinulata TaxID=1163345 RepID=UPI0025A09721|nr:atos homolog protein A [Diorhabda carinulata]XP_057655329.1 atos homolog protein A [Diorhabda carinulata]XP_057655330.1 atos homolog protein A [Diorhabda carinulata]XP_057655331.1 atos homolog protein A [Diorhabda carinulata]
MHSTNFGSEQGNAEEGDILVSVATLVTEGRIPGGINSKSKKFYEGPHCTRVKGAFKEHKCDLADSLCMKFDTDRQKVLNFCKKGIPLCIEVILTCECKEFDETTENLEDTYVLEQWHFSIRSKKPTELLHFNVTQLASAIRSQLYFSQITAWLTTQDDTSQLTIAEDNFRYHLTAPGKALATPSFHLSATKHDFPITEIGNGLVLQVSCLSLPRSSTIPNITCKNCAMKPAFEMDTKNNLLDDRMHISCKLKGKHRCEDLEEDENIKIANKVNVKRLCSKSTSPCEASTSKNKPKLQVYIENSNYYTSASTTKRNGYQSSLLDAKNDLNKDKGQLLLEAIERSGQMSTSESDISNCDKRESDILSIREKTNFNVYVDKHCDSPVPLLKEKKMRDISNIDPNNKRAYVRQKIIFEDEEGKGEIPSPLEQAKFRKDLDSAASMVFHARTGLPLTSSPAPVRRGKTCFDFDSSINSVSAIKSALFSTSFSTDDESESEGSIVSPCSPELLSNHKGDVTTPVKYRRRGHSASLLGSFEESVLNGRLEPASTVHGFTAELGASGSFVPKHLVVPVTVFFYTLGETDKVSSPYLSHINLGKKGYNVPKSGTVQVTLFNPLGTVVKMFVIMYDLSDMPPNSQTFIRQRTLYMPTNCNDTNLEWGPKWLRYLIHLRFMSSKSGKIYLHSDIRMIIFRKCDMDTATAHGIEMSYELRSFTRMPTNPRYSPRK